MDHILPANLCDAFAGAADPPEVMEGSHFHNELNSVRALFYSAQEASLAIGRNDKGILYNLSALEDVTVGHHYLVTKAPPPTRLHEVDPQGYKACIITSHEEVVAQGT